VIRAIALLVLLACARVAAADAESDADRAFHAALTNIDALERVGATRPITRWTDDAWLEAARLAVTARDYPRGRRDLEQAIATSSDPELVRRARAELARLATLVGGAGEWTAVAAEHERLVPLLGAGGDPRATLHALEELVRANPGYPRRVVVMLAIANAWEREDEGERALRWLRDARNGARDAQERLHTHAELVRTLIRLRELADAERELATLAAPPALVDELRRSLERAQWRRSVRWAMWAILALAVGAAAFALRRASASWRAGVRRFVPPPAETIYLVPLAVVLVIVAYTGNPLVARAVRTIVLAGIGASWISGAILGGIRVTLRRAVVHALVALVAVGAVTYLAVDDGHLIDFVLETWRAGHERG
jgi:hypothetical protein